MEKIKWIAMIPQDNLGQDSERKMIYFTGVGGV